MAISKKQALRSDGKLKKGFYYDHNGKIQKAKIKPVCASKTVHNAAVKLAKWKASQASKQTKLMI